MAEPAPYVAPKVDALASNCYLYVKSIYPTLPLANRIVSNTTPYIGAVAFFEYGKKDGDLPHYAVVTKLEDKGFWVKDTNFGGPGYRTHFVEWSDTRLRGFFNPLKGSSST